VASLPASSLTTLTSSGTTFSFEDEPDDVWGVVSGGVNFFNPSAQTSVFAKVDVAFGEETDGIAARGGMRISW
jgi:autotransporter family porin